MMTYLVVFLNGSSTMEVSETQEKLRDLMSRLYPKHVIETIEELPNTNFFHG